VKHRKNFVTGLISQLAQKEVDLDAQNANGETALHIATLYKNAEAIIVLSSLGASPSKITKFCN
jgi:ankyrin repeat protein